MVSVAVIYYSSTGNVHALAEAIAEGAESANATVRLRRARELASDEAIAQNPAWQRHHSNVARMVDEAEIEDLAWADAIAFGSPSRFGTPAAQLMQFIDQAGGLWASGALADKAATAFTSALNPHGGNESTILALSNVFYHWGCVLVPPGYTSDVIERAGGNPYGISWASVGKQMPDDATLEAARYHGRRLVLVAEQLKAGNALLVSGGAAGPTS